MRVNARETRNGISATAGQPQLCEDRNLVESYTDLPNSQSAAVGAKYIISHANPKIVLVDHRTVRVVNRKYKGLPGVSSWRCC